MSGHLSVRIRPNSEAAPWVIEEIRKLEEEVKRLREAVRQIHAMAESGRDFAASEAVRDIYKITKGMVE